MTRLRRALAPLLLALAFQGCADEEASAPAPAPTPAPAATPAEGPEAQGAAPSAGDPQMQRAAAARDALSSRLMGRVMEAVKEGGHASAVAVCSEDASTITEAVGEEFGVKVGRTAERLRNPDNAPPEWVASRIGDRPRTPQHERTSDGGLRALYPIVLAQPCLACHGNADELGAGVAAALAERYPEDRATGFAVGDLRGWLWVEVPPA